MGSRRHVLAVAVVAAVLAGCAPQQAAAPAVSTTTGILLPGVPTEGSRPPADGLPQAAEPQVAPPPSGSVPGRVIPIGRHPEGVAVDAMTHTVAIATRAPDQLVLVDADSGAITARIPLPGSARHLDLAGPGGPVLVPVETANGLVRVQLPLGPASPLITTGTSPHDAATAANGTVFVGNELGGTVAALRGSRVVKLFTDAVQPAGLAAAGNAIGMLDARTNTLTVYDAERLTIVGSTPAGAGPTHLVADRHGRMIAVDTRGDTIRVFDPLPAPREVATTPQPAAPYGLAYDPRRDRLWVASSGIDQVIGYDMSQPTPRVIQRIRTVQNPYTLGVDSTTGRLFVAGVTDGALQVVDAAGQR